jgi:hypothetical protein
MTEAEIATRAPENDAQAPTEAPATTPAVAAPAATSAETHSGLGEHCTTDRPAPAGLASTGEIVKIADVDVSRELPFRMPDKVKQPLTQP